MEKNEMMMNEVITTEAVEEVTTQMAAPSGNSGLKNLAIVGGIMTLGAVAWEFAVKPIGRKVKAGVQKACEKQKNKKKPQPVEDTEDVMDYEIDDIEPIE